MAGPAGVCRGELGLLSRVVAGTLAAPRSAGPARASIVGQVAAASLAGAASSIRRLPGHAAPYGQPSSSDVRDNRPGHEPRPVGARHEDHAGGWRTLPQRGGPHTGPHGGALSELPDVDGRPDRPHDARSDGSDGRPVRRGVDGIVDPHDPGGWHRRDLLHAVLPCSARTSDRRKVSGAQTARPRPQTGPVRGRAGAGRSGIPRPPA